jgi:hypothetical protein
MRTRRQRADSASKVIEHADADERGLQNPDDFLDRNHPENDQYMLAVEHVQRQIMHASSQLRSKQVKILKAIFSGMNYTQAANANNTTAITVSRLVHSPLGSRLLNLLQYHLKLIEGPNEAQRRALLWRIAIKAELDDPKTAIKATEALNKMHFQDKQLKQAMEIGNNPTAQAAVVVNINQQLLPKGNLD